MRIFSLVICQSHNNGIQRCRRKGEWQEEKKKQSEVGKKKTEVSDVSNKLKKSHRKLI